MSEDAGASAEGVWFAYTADRWVLRDFSLSVPTGTALTILGPSGSGKTTLLKLLAGLLRPQRGRVDVLGHSTDRGLPLALRARVGYIPQQLGLVRGMTALENVLMGALGRRRGPLPLLGVFPKEEVEAARRWLERLGIADRADQKAYRLSGGERQRVAIARTLLQNPAIVFADEFVSDLDEPRAAEIVAEMRDLGEEQGITLICNMHDLSLVRELQGSAVVIRDGRLLCAGRARDLSPSLLAESVRA